MFEMAVFALFIISHTTSFSASAVGQNTQNSSQQETEDEESGTETEVLSTPDDPPIKASYYPSDVEEDTVGATIGYDSDGHVPPDTSHWDTYHAEAVLPSSGGPTQAQAVTTAPRNTFVLITDADISKMKVDELRTALDMRGISKKGLKNELVEKLKRAMVDKVGIIDKETTCAPCNGFPSTAQWELIDSRSLDTLQDPRNEVEDSYAPSDRHGLAQGRKYNYKESWHRDDFDGECKQPSIDDEGVVRKDDEGNVIMTMSPITELTPNDKFISQNRLNEESHPADWVRAFLPNSKEKGSPANTFCTDKWSSYLNTRAWQDLAGIKERGGSYDTFVPFTPDEVEKHIALYIVQGLIPSPTLSRKLSRQGEEPIQGNDLIASALGKGAGKRHQQFRKWFAIQDPLKVVPNRKEFPNWKVDPLLRHLNQVSMKAVHLPENLACDEQTISFQGRSIYKLRVKHKNAGDGFQCDAICNDGYTYSFYFRHQAPPEKYTKEGLSPLHSRVLFLFDQLKSKHHCLWMDNLYMSAQFAKTALNSRNKVKIHGVTRNHNKGVPKIIEQQEMQNEQQALAVKGTVKVAVLKNDPVIKDLVAISYYDSKPVYFLSTIIKNVTWTMKEKKVYNPATAKMYPMKFIRPNFADDYNQDMDHVDITDHLAKNYQLGRNLLQRKWWWPIFLWALMKCIINAYVLYLKWHKQRLLKYKSHYDFRQDSALAWLDPARYWPHRHKVKRKKRKQCSGLSTLNSRLRKRVQSDISSLSQNTLCSQSTTNTMPPTVVRCTKISDATVNSSLFNEKRLTISNEYHHIAETVQAKYSECQFHKWCLKGFVSANVARVKKKLCYCPTCHVILCLNCYSPFHKVHDLRTIKHCIPIDGDNYDNLVNFT